MSIDTLKKSTKKLKILFVEDSLSARKITQRMLSKFFDHIDIAEDGQIAIDKYREFYDTNEVFYDIVFTDLEMPNMDGRELSKLIIEFNPLQEIVVLSGVKEFKVIVDLINVGVKKFISKPVDVEELQSIISEIMANIRKKQLKEEDQREVIEHNELLQQREEENKAILESKVKEFQEFSHALDVSAIVSKTDPKGNITYVNDLFCEVCGYSADELVGKNNRILKCDKRSSSFYKKLWNTINSKKIYKTLFENRHKDGSVYYIETTINPILDINGEIVEFIAVSHDMTQLILSNEAARAAQKSKEDFFENISHEMKTPLNSILGFSSLLEKRVQDNEKSLMMVKTISETGNQLNNLVSFITDMRKIQDRSLELKNFPFHPSKDLKECLDAYKEKAEQKSLVYTVNVDSLLPEELSGDLQRITEVISIVLDNAIKFTNTGGKVDVNISYDVVDKMLLCAIQDTGIGIAKEDQSKIFAIGQLDSSANRAYEGAGIGLNIASNLIKIMKGKLKVKSIPSRGSLFTIELPLSK
ncbi:ATP-binding protein [Sulfurimonas sp.]|nr:ATP-binding protein [Sulfurimonas sp.]